MKAIFGFFVTVAMMGAAHAGQDQVRAWDEWTAEGTEIGEMAEMDLSDPTLKLIEDYSEQSMLMKASGGCSTLQVIVEKTSSPQTLTAYCDGAKVLGPVATSTGKSGHSTPSGTFKVFNKIPMAYSNTYNNAPMARLLVFKSCGKKGTKSWKPNCIGVHATVKSNYKRLGGPASHGCVRLTMANAQALWNYAIASGETIVTVR